MSEAFSSRIGFIHPGQGSQSVGMGKFLFDNFPEAKLLFEEASDAISVNLKKICFDGPESELMKTENTQPAIVTVSIATIQVLKNEFGVSPLATAGHSVGEYAAAYSAGCMTAADAIRAVKFRGLFMQQSVPEGVGAMAAFMGPDPKEVVAICKWVTETSNLGILEPANYNAPGQIVISGHASALQWLEENLVDYRWSSLDEKPKRVKLIPLKVSAPFHCSLMMPAQEKMKDLLADMVISAPKIPFIQNVSADATTTSEDVVNLLVEQMSSSVRWIECTEKFKNFGINELVEVGSGQVLKGLTKKIWADLPSFKNTNSLEDLKLFVS